MMYLQRPHIAMHVMALQVSLTFQVDLGRGDRFNLVVTTCYFLSNYIQPKLNLKSMNRKWNILSDIAQVEIHNLL